MRNKLDLILLSDNASERFLEEYKNEDFKTWINYYLPQIELCRNQIQDNPWHIYDCLTHILKSVEAMNKQSAGMEDKTRRMLAYCMFYHDIGKPESHIRRYSKQYGREVDSFFNHNERSADVASRTLNKFGFDESEVKVMTKLIYKHDIFMFIRENDKGNPHHRVLSKELIKEEIEDLNTVGDGKQLLKYLIMIGRADNLAQNPRLTGMSLRLLDKMEKMIES